MAVRVRGVSLPPCLPHDPAADYLSGRRAAVLAHVGAFAGDDEDAACVARMAAGDGGLVDLDAVVAAARTTGHAPGSLAHVDARVRLGRVLAAVQLPAVRPVLVVPRPLPDLPALVRATGAPPVAGDDDQPEIVVPPPGREARPIALPIPVRARLVVETTLTDSFGPEGGSLVLRRRRFVALDGPADAHVVVVGIGRTFEVVAGRDEPLPLKKGSWLVELWRDGARVGAAILRLGRDAAADDAVDLAAYVGAAVATTDGEGLVRRETRRVDGRVVGVWGHGSAGIARSGDGVSLAP